MSHQIVGANVAASQERYGSVIGTPTSERNLQYGKALKIIVSADGAVSEPEIAAFAALASQFGMPQSHFDAFLSFDPHGTTLADALKGWSNDALAARLVYDAIRISSADGYHERERAAVREAARVLGITEERVLTLEGVVGTERALGALKASLLGG